MVGGGRSDGHWSCLEFRFREVCWIEKIVAVVFFHNRIIRIAFGRRKSVV
jgi:hypothetical protein